MTMSSIYTALNADGFRPGCAYGEAYGECNTVPPRYSGASDESDVFSVPP